jgi:hypothetical protein
MMHHLTPSQRAQLEAVAQNLRRACPERATRTQFVVLANSLRPDYLWLRFVQCDATNPDDPTEEFRYVLLDAHGAVVPVPDTHPVRPELRMADPAEAHLFTLAYYPLLEL